MEGVSNHLLRAMQKMNSQTSHYKYYYIQHIGSIKVEKKNRINLWNL